MTARELLLAAALLPLAGPPQGGSRLVDCLAGKPTARHALPPDLREISGLVMTEDGRLLAHDDERARVVELNYRTARVTKSFRFGRSMPLADFEAIVLAGNRLFLVTSDGALYEGKEAPNGQAVPYSILATGAGLRCEVEGAAFEPADRSIRFLCKTARKKELEGAITLLRWSLDQGRWMTPERTSAPLDASFRKRFGGEFRGSDLARDPVTGNYLAVSAIDRAVVELSADGRLLGFGALGRHHPQAEGVAIARDGTVVVSDEGGKTGPGHLTVYACGR